MDLYNFVLGFHYTIWNTLMDQAGALQTNILAAATKGGGDDNANNELMKLNQVYYNIPPSLSLVSKRTMTRCQFQQTSYNQIASGQYCTAIFNTGEFQVSGPTSFLVLQMGIDVSQQATGVFSAGTTGTLQASSAKALLGQGGIMNTFQEVTFTTASGTEVDRQQEKGLLQAHVDRNTYSKPYYDSAGELQGLPGGSYRDCYDTLGWPGVGTAAADYQPPWLYPVRNTTYLSTNINNLIPASDVAAAQSSYDISKSSGELGSVAVSFNSTYDATYNPTPGQAPYFIIPLSNILGCFNPYMKALIPSASLAGGRLDIRWKAMTEALIATGAGITSAASAAAFLNSIQIYNIYLMLDSFQMNDSVLKRLNDVAAGDDGLSLMFDTWDWAQTSTNTLNFEAQVSQARSRIIRSFCVIRDSAEIKNPWGNSLASEAAVKRYVGYTKAYTTSGNNSSYQQLVNNYQAQLGALYFPQQPLTTLEELCMNQYYIFSKNYANCDDLSAISFSEFLGALGVGHFSNGSPVNPLASGTPNPALLPATRAKVLTPLPPWTQNWGSAVYGFLAERSQLLQLTGLPISNARLLRHRFVLNYNPISATTRQIDVFTQYTRVEKIFLGGRVVMRE